jgi:uncharacterized protein
MHLELWQALLVLLAGVWAGTINTIVGSGSLVTFPVLVAMGLNPVNAVVSNAIGLVAGGVSGAWGYREELRTVPGTLKRLLPASIVGALLGAWLLLHLPESVFGVVSPILVAVAVVLVIVQPRLAAWAKARSGAVDQGPDAQPFSAALVLLVFLTGVYGGYFTAAQGVILMGIFGVMLQGSLQQANAVKVVLSLAVNLVAAVAYLFFAYERIDWLVAALIAVGSLFGGWLGARIGRRLSPLVLRGCIVVLGVVAFVHLIWQLVAP